MLKIFVSPPAADVSEKKKILIVKWVIGWKNLDVWSWTTSKRFKQRRILESDTTGKRFIFVEISFAEFFWFSPLISRGLIVPLNYRLTARPDVTGSVSAWLKVSAESRVLKHWRIFIIAINIVGAPPPSQAQFIV